MKQAIVVGILLTVVAASARSGEVTHLFPDDAQLVLAVDVQALLDSEAFKSEIRGRSILHYLNDLAAAQPELKLQMETKGFTEGADFFDNLLRSTTRVYFAGFAGVHDSNIILKGKYDRNELVKKIEVWRKAMGEPFRMEVRDEIEIIDGVRGHEHNKIFVVDESTIVVSLEGVHLDGFLRTPAEAARRAQERRNRRFEMVLSRANGKSKPKLNKNMMAALKAAKFSANCPFRLAGYGEEFEDKSPLVLLQAEVSLTGKVSHWAITFFLPTAKDAEAFEREALDTLKWANGIKEAFGDTPILQSFKEAKVDRKENVVTVKIAVPLEDLFATVYSALFKKSGS